MDVLLHNIAVSPCVTVTICLLKLYPEECFTILTLTLAAGAAEWLAGRVWAFALKAKMQSMRKATTVLRKLRRKVDMGWFFAIIVSPLKNSTEAKSTPIRLFPLFIHCFSVNEKGLTPQCRRKESAVPPRGSVKIYPFMSNKDSTE